MSSFWERNRRLMCVGLLGASLIGAGAAVLRAEEKGKKEEEEVKVSIDQVPSAVKATLLKEAEGAPITQVDKETEKGKVIYEADAKINGKNYEIKVAEDGSLISKTIDNEDDEKATKEKK